MAGWRRSRFKGNRPGNYKKNNTGKFNFKTFHLQLQQYKTFIRIYIPIFNDLLSGGSFDCEDEEDEENEVDWDPTKSKDSHNLKSVNDALRDSLRHVVTKPAYPGQNDSGKGTRSASKSKQIAHLNGLVRLWNIKRDLERNETKNTCVGQSVNDTSGNVEIDTVIDNQPQNCDHGLHIQELLLCLRVPLIHESSEVRASTLRTIRLLLSQPEHVDLLYEINLHYLMVR